MISITGGHGDFRQPFEVPKVIGGPLSRMEQIGGSMIADSPDDVRVRVREQLLLGASQIKLTAGGGVASPHSPLDVSTFTDSELRAAVEAADNWGTYVTVHAYTPRAIQGAIAAGVKVLEHGHLMDEATARLMAEKGIWLSVQPFLDDEDAIPFPPDSSNRARALQVFQGTDNAYALAKKYKLKTAFGTDVLFSAALAASRHWRRRTHQSTQALKKEPLDASHLGRNSHGRRGPPQRVRYRQTTNCRGKMLQHMSGEQFAGCVPDEDIAELHDLGEAVPGDQRPPRKGIVAPWRQTQQHQYRGHAAELDHGIQRQVTRGLPVEDAGGADDQHEQQNG
jgi:hypothetical protein